MHLILIVCAGVIILDLILAAPAVITEPNAVDTLDKEVFKIPRQLRVGDEIHVSGLMTSDKERLTVNLVKGNDNAPDYSNVVCQVKMDFPGVTSKEDRVTVNTIVDGKLTEMDEEVKSTHMFVGDEFTIKFLITEHHKVELLLTDSSTSNDCKLTYGLDVIQFLTLGGDVHRVHTLNFRLV